MSTPSDRLANSGGYCMSAQALAVVLGFKNTADASRFFSKHGAKGDTFTAAQVRTLTAKRFLETGKQLNRETERWTETTEGNR